MPKYKPKSAKAPLYLSPVSAGFPSPADDFIDKDLDLNEFLIKHQAATFFLKVDGNSMIEAGIHDKDLIIVDRALNPTHNSIAVVWLDGEFTLKRIHKRKDGLYLMPENPRYQPIKVHETDDFQVWGVVSYVIHQLHDNAG